MSDWFCGTRTLWSFAWTQIDARQNTRLWALATVDARGVPAARTVVLRGASLDRYAVQFHTDLGSSKVLDLTQNPQASLLCWLPAHDLQIRLQVDVDVQSGVAVSDVWANVPDPARQAYGAKPPPATPIGDALAYEKPADAAAFAVLDCTVSCVDILHLGADHRRAIFSRDSDWVGQWVAP